MKRPGLKDVAARSGVSVSSVSMILNNRGEHYSTETISKVQAAVQELAYRPNAFARSVKQGRYGTIALVMSPEYHRSTLPSGVLKGISESLMAQNLHLAVAYLPDQQLTSPETMPRLLREWSCDGMLLNYHAHVPTQLEELVERHRLPVVWVNTKRENDCVYPDDFGAGVRATEALIAAGHRRIAYVDSMYHRAQLFDVLHFSKPDRLGGYREAMRKAGLSPLCILPEDVLNAERDVQTVLRGPGSFTAAIGYAMQDIDVVAMSVARAGLTVPDDISLVTFSGDFSILGVLALTLLVIPEQQVGGAAVEMLLEKMRAPKRRLAPRIVAFEFEAGKSLTRVREGAS